MTTPGPYRVVRHATWRVRRVQLALDSLGRQATRRARLLPNFFIIGAQKCGTTSLFAYLLQHQEVGGYKHKEVHYFDLNYERGPDWYRGHFPLAIPRGLRAVGEASPEYIFHREAPSRLHEFDPQARLIALVRDPVARAFSHYQHMRRVGLEPLSFADAIAAEPERIRRGSRERMGYSYLARGCYLDQLERWLDVFAPEQLLVLSSEELARDPETTVGEAFRFLRLPPQSGISFQRHNERKYERMDPALEEDLRRYFDEPNRRLYALLGRDLGWSRPSGPS